MIEHKPKTKWTISKALAVLALFGLISLAVILAIIYGLIQFIKLAINQ